MVFLPLMELHSIQGLIEKIKNSIKDSSDAGQDIYDL